MRDVVLTIRPRWAELIYSGRKTVEWRHTYPEGAGDVCLVNAVTYTWERKDGTTIQAYECFGKHACREPVVTTCDCTDTAFHNAYLRLTGYTEQEYREKLKQESPTVYAARVAAGIYQEA